MLRAIYSRTNITLGSESFQPNIGVSQGLVISPALFNIYAASLLEMLEGNRWCKEDLLGCADNHLVISITKGDLRTAIALTINWCAEANIEVNPDKFGILEVPPRGDSSTKTVSNDVLFYLVDVDFSEWERVEEARVRKRWEARVERNLVGSLKKFKIKYRARYLPKDNRLKILGWKVQTYIDEMTSFLQK